MRLNLFHVSQLLRCLLLTLLVMVGIGGAACYAASIAAQTPTAQTPTAQTPAAQITATQTTATQTTINTGNSYYVAVTGNDAGPGTEAAPFRTIQMAADHAQAGDTIYVRDGVYAEQVSLHQNGTAASPIRLLAYPGEKPVIDGAYALPVKPDSYDWPFCDTTVTPPRCVHYETLVSITGNYVEFAGFDVQRSLGRAVRSVGTQGLRLRNNRIHDNRSAGIYLHNVTNALVEQNEVWHSGDYAPYARSPLTIDWPEAVAAWESSYVTYRGNQIYHNWAEGISTGKNSTNITIEDNIIYDNYALQVYVHRSQNATVQRNFIYCTNEPAFLREGNPSAGIALADEEQFDGEQINQNHLIRDNVIAGCGYNLILIGSTYNYVLRNVQIIRNTLVNAVSNPGQTEASALVVHGQRDYENVVIKQNTIYQAKHQIAQVARKEGLLFEENLWSRQPPAAARSATDFVGDPGLADPNVVLQNGQAAIEWFQPAADTPPALIVQFGPQRYLNPIYQPSNRASANATATEQEPQPVALYTFDEGEGDMVYDQSGVMPALDLQIQQPERVTWHDHGLTIDQATMIASTQPADKVIDQCQISNELSLETWIKPTKLLQRGPARILTLSGDPTNRNFTLGHGLLGEPEKVLYDVRLRTTTTDLNGLPSLSSASDAVTTTLTHLVYTRNATGEAALYVNGNLQNSQLVAGDFEGWNANFQLALGNEFTEERSWLGAYYFVAIYCQALSADTIREHFGAGVPNDS